MHTVPASLSPLSERTRRSIHHPRIWGGGEGEGTGGVSRVICFHASFNIAFHFPFESIYSVPVETGPRAAGVREAVVPNSSL